MTNNDTVSIIIEKFIGRKDEFSLEARIFLTTCLISLVTLLINIPMNYLVGVPSLGLLMIALFIAVALIYYCVRVLKKLAIGFFLFCLLSNIFFTLNYYQNSGINGPTLLIFLLSLFLVIVTAPKIQFRIWAPINIVLTEILLFLQYNHPKSVPNTYQTIRDRYVDFAYSYIIIALMILWIALYIRNSYNKQRLMLIKKAEDMETAEKQYRALFEANPNPMWIYQNKSLHFIAVNNAAVAKYGYTREEFLSMTIEDIRPGTEHNRLDETIKAPQRGLRDASVWTHQDRSGEIFPVSVVSHDVFFNGLDCRMAMATDISRIMQNEQRLREAYRKEKRLYEELAAQYQVVQTSEKENRIMGQVMNKIKNLVLIIQEDGIISWVNQAFADFTGYTLNEVIGKKTGDLLCGEATDPETISRLRAAIAQKAFFCDELINYKKNGELYWTQSNISPIYDENGQFQFYISVENVITERKEKEQKIAAQHTALQKVAWSISHELRRPICSVMGLISVLKDMEDPNERKHCIEALESCSRELDQLVKDANRKIEHMAVQEHSN